MLEGVPVEHPHDCPDTRRVGQDAQGIEAVEQAPVEWLDAPERGPHHLQAALDGGMGVVEIKPVLLGGSQHRASPSACAAMMVLATASSLRRKPLTTDHR
jgi:hypothetical protein